MKNKRTAADPFIRELNKEIYERAAGRRQGVTTTRSLAAWFTTLVAHELDKNLQGSKDGKTIAQRIAERISDEAMYGPDPITAAQLIIEMTERLEEKGLLQ